MSGVWTPRKSVSESNQDPLSGSSHRRLEEEDCLEVVVHQQNDDSNASAEECEFNDCIRILTVTNLTPNYEKVQLGVVRYTLAQPEKVND